MDEAQYHYTPGERQFLLYRFLMENTKSKPTNTSHVVSREQVFDYLLSYGIEIDRKTLYTDFDVLRATMKCNVDYNRSLRGYRSKSESPFGSCAGTWPRMRSNTTSMSRHAGTPAAGIPWTRPSNTVTDCAGGCGQRRPSWRNNGGTV